MVVRWLFEDTATAESYTFEVNPRAGGSPSYKKTISYQNTSAPDGKTLVFEGLDAAQEIEWEGVILQETQYDAFLTWYQKRRQIRLTDDLGRQMWIYIKSFEPKRRRGQSHPWLHDYTITAVILSWV